MEIMWVHDPPEDEMKDLKSLIKSLDDYQIVVETSGASGRFVEIDADGATLLESETETSFKCPHCREGRFYVLNGHHDGASVVGLSCVSCNTYGLLLPSSS